MENENLETPKLETTNNSEQEKSIAIEEKNANSNSNISLNSAISQPPSVLRCILGAVVSAAIAFVLWNFTQTIAATFAAKQITSDNMIVIRVSVAVRTLVIGMITLGTGVFGLAAVGLFGLGLQTLFGKPTKLEN
ncbi:MAG: DUF3082 domain-containing protein [Synechococcales bacterium]|nr:DUF3082 domain-containing protein [Synechococcales bacterium]